MRTTPVETAPPEAFRPHGFTMRIRREAGNTPLSGTRRADGRGRAQA